MNFSLNSKINSSKKSWRDNTNTCIVMYLTGSILSTRWSNTVLGDISFVMMSHRYIDTVLEMTKIKD